MDLNNYEELRRRGKVLTENIFDNQKLVVIDYKQKKKEDFYTGRYCVMFNENEIISFYCLPPEKCKGIPFSY